MKVDFEATVFIELGGFFFFQNNPKDLDLSYKTDLDLLDCFARETPPPCSTPSYITKKYGTYRIFSDFSIRNIL